MKSRFFTFDFTAHQFARKIDGAKVWDVNELWLTKDERDLYKRENLNYVVTWDHKEEKK